VVLQTIHALINVQEKNSMIRGIPRRNPQKMAKPNHIPIKRPLRTKKRAGNRRKIKAKQSSAHGAFPGASR
jgi:hypothetical protein